ncbi:uncharacterized protein LOC131005623 [Salvia miltiorrhiza]|uniref:uncharacterized protein LOC131005623 n=1 Tax=Salvia miltiorrhiza TaxID=226208 RepID=UPI0025ACD38F|nr:uncharacterized protein LOC131005623 [Salvia miltiorrhiza]
METIVIVGGSEDGFGADDEKPNLWLEFHKVDLKQGGKVEKNCYPKLRCWGMVGTMSLVKSKLCLAGCTATADEADEYACFLDLDSDSNSYSDSEWKHLPLPVGCLAFGTLDGKLYGHNHHDRYAEDENLGSDWFEFIRDRLPEDEEGEHVMIPDPPNNRILFYTTSGKIYAYDPSHRESRLRLVAADVPDWSPLVAVVANIAYIAFHPRWGGDYPWMLCAYDLSNGGKHLKCVWTSMEVDGVDISDLLCHIRGLFHLPNTNNFWLAACTPDRSTSVHLHFVKFQASRTDDDDRILCTPLVLVYSPIENTAHVFHFLLIHGSLHG